MSKKNKLQMRILNWKIGSTITNLYPKHEGATQGHELNKPIKHLLFELLISLKHFYY